MDQCRLGFIGAGRMATALAQGLIQRGLVTADAVVASDPSIEAAQRFAERTGARLATDNRGVADQAEVLFLAVKPQHMEEVLAGLKDRLDARHLVVSVAAGVRLESIEAGLGPGPRLVRVMPNTPCLVAEGAAAYCLGRGAGEDEGRLVENLLGAVAVVHRVDEPLLDAVTGLSGSGPAYVYLLIEALSDGGVRMGLPRDVATSLAAHTVRGAAAMVTSGEHPAVLKDGVTSPGGTTIAGLHCLETSGVRGALIDAVVAATRRSRELGNQ